MKNFLTHKFGQIDSNAKGVIKSTTGSIGIKVLGILASFFTSVFLGRMLGPKGLGIVSLVNQSLIVLVTLSLFGMQHVIVKRVAIAKEREEYASIKSTLFSSFVFNGIIALTITILCFLLRDIITKDIFKEPLFKEPFLIVLITLLPLTYGRLWAYALNGLQKIWQSNLFLEVLNILFVAIALLILFLLHEEITVIVAVSCYSIGRMLVFLISGFYWKKTFKKVHSRYKLVLKPMIKMGLPLLLVSATGIIASNADTIMLGWLGNASQVGLYSVAARIALLSGFILHASNAAISPKLASMYLKKDILGMQRMIKPISGALLIISLCFLLVVALWGKGILLLWGNEFSVAYLPLVILCLGQFFNVSTGCSGMLLIMCGFEKTHGFISIASVVTNLILNFTLIPMHGVLGASLATAITVSLENLLKVFLVKQKIGIWTFPTIVKL